jgi:hypothetical protein
MRLAGYVARMVEIKNSSWILVGKSEKEFSWDT